MPHLRSELLRFGVAGLVGLAVDIAVLYAALYLGCGPLVGRVLSFLAAVVATYAINRRFTFGAAAAASTLSPWQQWWRYLGAMAFGGAVNYGVYCLIVLLWPTSGALASLQAFAPMVAVACGSLAGMTLNFLSAKLLVFKAGAGHAR